MRGLNKMFQHKRLIFCFTLYLILLHAIDLKTLNNKKGPTKQKIKNENHKTTTVSPDADEGESEENNSNTDSTRHEVAEEETNNEEEPVTESPEEESSDSEESSNNDNSEEESDDKESESEDSSSSDEHRGKITKTKSKHEANDNQDEPDVTPIEEDYEMDQITTTPQPAYPITTTRRPSNMVPTGSWTLACPNPCSQSCAPSCTPQCCEGHFSMTAPVPISDEPPLLPSAPMNPPPMMQSPQTGINSMPPQCPDYCNNNPSCNSMCDPSCCSLQSLKTFLDTAAGLLNTACPPQCNSPNCNNDSACPAACCDPSMSSNQNSNMPSPGMTQQPQNLNCPPECASYGQQCSAICRSECCPVSASNNNENSSSTDKPKDNISPPKSEEMEQAIVRGQAKCPDYCNSTECLSKCPIVCC